LDGALQTGRDRAGWAGTHYRRPRRWLKPLMSVGTLVLVAAVAGLLAGVIAGAGR
jgi:hypothetical protein